MASILRFRILHIFKYRKESVAGSTTLRASIAPLPIHFQIKIMFRDQELSHLTYEKTDRISRLKNANQKKEETTGSITLDTLLPLL